MSSIGGQDSREHSKIRLPSISLLAQSLPALTTTQVYEQHQRVNSTVHESSSLNKSPFEEDKNLHSQPVSSGSPLQSSIPHFPDVQNQHQQHPHPHPHPSQPLPQRSEYHPAGPRYHYMGEYQQQQSQYPTPVMLSREEAHRRQSQPQPLPHQLQHQPSPTSLPFSQAMVYRPELIPASYPQSYSSPNAYIVKNGRVTKNTDRKLKPRLYCQRCGITDTPEWRKGPNGARTLCNACGLYHAKILKRDGAEAAAAAVLNGEKVVKKTFQRRHSYVVADYSPPKSNYELNYQFHSEPVHHHGSYFEPHSNGAVPLAFSHKLTSTVSYPPPLKLTPSYEHPHHQQHPAPYYPTSNPTYVPVYSKVSSPISDREHNK